MSDRAASVILLNSLSRRKGPLLAVLASSLLLGACAQGGGGAGFGETSTLGRTETSATGQTMSAQPKTELGKAIEYWGKQNRDNPRDLDSALNFARNLKAAGQKGEALQVLQQAAIYHGQDRKLASEYGRLALDLDQTNVAQQVLSVADDPTNPDWRVISARGTVLAKQAKYTEAVAFYEKALRLSVDEPSVLNNLALAYTMSGEPQKAEELLRKAAANDGPHSARIRQNLALVLGVQGKHEEARQLAANESSADVAANATLMQQMVKATPQKAAGSMTATASITPGDAPGTAVGGWSTRIVAAKRAR